MAALMRQDYQRARTLSPRWADVLDHRERMRQETERLQRLKEAARQAEEQRLAEEQRRLEAEREQRIERAKSNAGVLSGIWNWLLGKSKCPQCGTRHGREESSRLVDRWQEVMTDYARVQGNYWPQAVYNVSLICGQMRCDACGYRWKQTYSECVRA
jgi:DNA repair exonuclease SbcCD ATPase subunit